MAERRHEQDDGAVAVAEPVTKDTLAAQLGARQQQVHEADQRRRELEGLEMTHGLSLMQTQELVGLERWIAAEQAHVERLQTEMQRAQIAFDLDAAVAHHDSFIEQKQACYEQIAEAIGGLYAAFQHLADVDREQKAPLQSLTSPSGQPFAPISAEELLQNVVSRMPGALSWQGVIFGQRLTQADLAQMRDVDSGVRPISERMIERFLQGRQA